MIQNIAIRTALLLAFTSATQGCAKSLPDPVHFAEMPKDYSIETASIDSDNRFTIKLVSKTTGDLCIGVDDWPNKLGQVSGGSSRATVSGEGKIFPAADTNFGYCVGEICTLRLRPHQTLSGFVNYKEFGPPPEIASLGDKHLTYNVRPFVCPTGKAR